MLTSLEETRLKEKRKERKKRKERNKKEKRAPNNEGMAVEWV